MNNLDDRTPRAGPVEGTTVPPVEGEIEVLNRIGTVRRQQGMSLRSVARQMGAEIAQVREQEEETADLQLSQLYRWQHALEVPVVDLLVDPGTPLSRPVMERAQMLRLMKTAAAILERSRTAGMRRMAQMLVDQLVAIMPELQEVSPWHTVGQRRSMKEYGRTAERCLSDDFLYHHPAE